MALTLADMTRASQLLLAPTHFCRAEVVKLHAEVARLRQAVREGEARLQQRAGEGSSREAEVAALQLELREARREAEVGGGAKLAALYA